MNYLEKTCEKYDDSPLIRVLMQLIPFGIGSAIANVKKIVGQSLIK